MLKSDDPNKSSLEKRYMQCRYDLNDFEKGGRSIEPEKRQGHSGPGKGREHKSLTWPQIEAI